MKKIYNEYKKYKWKIKNYILKNREAYFLRPARLENVETSVSSLLSKNKFSRLGKRTLRSSDSTVPDLVKR